MKSLFFATLAAMLLTGCSEESTGASPSPDPDTLDASGTAGDTSAAQDTGEVSVEVAEISAPTAWSDAVELVSFVGETTVSGDTQGGPSPGGMWGYQASAGCWLLPEATFFGGPARFFAPSPVPGQNSKLTVTLSPESDVDLNLVVLTMPLDEFWMPPEVELSSCYSSRVGGPGETEEKKIFTITDVANVLVMVAAPEGSAGGSFELSFLLEN